MWETWLAKSQDLEVPKPGGCCLLFSFLHVTGFVRSSCISILSLNSQQYCMRRSEKSSNADLGSVICCWKAIIMGFFAVHSESPSMRIIANIIYNKDRILVKVNCSFQLTMLGIYK